MRQGLGQGFEDALETRMMMMLKYSHSVAMFRLVKHSFSNLRSKLVADDVIKNVCDVITLILTIFGLDPTSYLSFTIRVINTEYVIFQK